MPGSESKSDPRPRPTPRPLLVRATVTRPGLPGRPGPAGAPAPDSRAHTRAVSGVPRRATATTAARRAGTILAALLASRAAAQFAQQGGKLVGTGAAGPAHQGYSVALSADGDTAILGGPFDAADAGAAWVFTRAAGAWSQQGSKLVAAGAAGVARFAKSVALSADGSTAIVGGPYDAADTGAAWVFTRNRDAWSQPGVKLVGTGAVGNAEQGWSVAISADGNTAIVGGPFDDSDAGAAWVFTRSGGVWSQQGAKLVGRGALGGAAQGYSVAVSADGNTAVLGGVADAAFAGAAWVFTRDAAVWSRQGSKLVAADAAGEAFLGYSTAISADGGTVIAGGYGDGSTAGAAWVFTRGVGGAWSQQGGKLVGADAVGTAAQGWSVAISGDGDSAVVGGPSDDGGAGAAWVFTRGAGVWSQAGGKLVGTGAAGAADQGAVAISADATTIVAGGSYDAGMTGAAWVFAAPCVPPAISAQPRGGTVLGGQTATLRVTATGSAPLAYRWYQGRSGDTSMPAGGDASTFTTPPLVAPTSFWVRVGNACGHADSAAATVAVGPRARRHLHRVADP
jgi:Ig-like domain CHU_C associated